MKNPRTWRGLEGKNDYSGNVDAYAKTACYLLGYEPKATMARLTWADLSSL